MQSVPTVVFQKEDTTEWWWCNGQRFGTTMLLVTICGTEFWQDWLYLAQCSMRWFGIPLGGDGGNQNSFDGLYGKLQNGVWTVYYNGCNTGTQQVNR